jgi:hypothetical protein
LIFYQINEDSKIRTRDRLVIKTLIPCQKTNSIKKLKLLSEVSRYDLYYSLIWIILEGVHLSDRKIWSLGKDDNYSMKLYSSLINKLVSGGSSHFKSIIWFKIDPTKIHILCGWRFKINFLYVTFILNAGYYKRVMHISMLCNRVRDFKSFVISLF